MQGRGLDRQSRPENPDCSSFKVLDLAVSHEMLRNKLIAEIPKRNDPVELRPVTRLYEIIEIKPFPASVRGRGLSECKFQVVIAFQIQPYDRGL